MDNRSNNQSKIIIVDDEEDVVFSSKILLESNGITHVVTMQDGRELLPYLEKHGPVAAIILDLLMPNISGMVLLPEIIKHYPEIPVVVMTASQEIDTAIACMKQGAFDYLVKPVEESRFISSVRRVIEMRSLRQEVGALRDSLLRQQLEYDEAFSSVITNSPLMKNIFRYIEAIAVSREPILVSGETGVGKSLVAEAIHRLSGCKGKFVSVSVAGLDETMFTDTLFGHKKGAFTGAETDRPGMVTQAISGTLFLDEIGDLDMSSQIKLLRLLQDQTYYPLGSDVAQKSDARIIAATNLDIHDLIKKDSFRQDLYFRLSSHQIEIPPLRQRQEDIPLLVGYFLNEAAMSMNKPTPDPTPELLTLLSTYHFPGNVRELRAMIYDAVALHRSGQFVSMESCKASIKKNRKLYRVVQGQNVPGVDTTIQTIGRFPTLKEFEKLLIDEALRQARGNQGIAATLLGISRPALNRRLMKLKSGKQDSQ